MIKVLDNCTLSGCFNAFSEIVAALDYIIDNNATLGVGVINMSLGTSGLFTGDCDESTSFNMAGAYAINTLRNMGVTAFAASGNNGSGTQMTSPACLSNVISVGSSDNADIVAGTSNSNASTDIFAPGVNITSLSRLGGTLTGSGTSAASPHAAGCAALLIASGVATTPAAIEARLETSPFQVTDPDNGLMFPRIDCRPANLPPVVDAGGPYTVLQGLPLRLTDASATDPNGDPLGLTWGVNSVQCSFSDPRVLHPAVTCTATGIFQVTLTVMDGAYQRSDAAVLTVLSPAQAIEALMAHVQSAGLDKNADKPLLSQLAVVLKSVLNGRPATAILQLQAFIDYVQAQAAKSIEGTDAAALIAAARQIIAALQISS
jgi:subtilisin family serine protease